MREEVSTPLQKPFDISANAIIATQRDGSQPLHLAAIRDHASCVRTLLSLAGSDKLLEATDLKGYGCLNWPL